MICLQYNYELMQQINESDVSILLREIWNERLQILRESTGGMTFSDTGVVSPGLKVKNKEGKLYTVLAIGPSTIEVQEAGEEAKISSNEIVIQNSEGRKTLLTKEKFENDYTIQ